MIISRQHTALLLRENANETESSAISHQKTQSICLKLIIFQNGTSIIRFRREFGVAEIWGVGLSVHELNVTIVESYGTLTLINFENILFENIRKKH